MLGEAGRTVYNTIIEAGGIIGLHRGGIVSIIVVNQTDALNRILIAVQLIKDFFQILCNKYVTDQFSLLKQDQTLSLRQEPQASLLPLR